MKFCHGIDGLQGFLTAAAGPMSEEPLKLDTHGTQPATG
jgi:hypothetical protein